MALVTVRGRLLVGCAAHSRLMKQLVTVVQYDFPVRTVYSFMGVVAPSQPTDRNDRFISLNMFAFLFTVHQRLITIPHTC